MSGVVDAQDQRERLFEQAKYGEITGDQADADAIRLGLGSLSRKPAPDQFRPDALTHWTLPMAVAWIAYLDLDEVREWSAPYRAECYEWYWQRWREGLDGPVHEGWHLEQRHKPTLSLLAISSTYDRVADGMELAMSVKDARESLWLALREGFFVATGINTLSRRRVEIPALDWHELVPVQGRNESDEVRIGLLGDGYRDVLVPTKSLMGFWRMPLPAKRQTLPDIIAPTGFGYMPLFCAAQWIATRGGSLDIDPADVEVWRPAFTDLLAAISSGAVKTVGVARHETQPVPPHLFVGIQVDHPYVEPALDMILSNELVLRSYPYVDDEQWRKGFDDSLVDRAGDRWRRLSVEKGDVGRLWPFDAAPDLSTGLPGRPALSRQLIEGELRRRGATAELAPTLRAEAEQLVDWLRTTHPKHPVPTVRTVENNIRKEYHSLKSTK